MFGIVTVASQDGVLKVIPADSKDSGEFYGALCDAVQTKRPDLMREFCDAMNAQTAFNRDPKVKLTMKECQEGLYDVLTKKGLMNDFDKYWFAPFENGKNSRRLATAEGFVEISFWQL